MTAAEGAIEEHGRRQHSGSDDRPRFDELATEYRTVGIGTKLYREICSLATSVVRSYDPRVYGHVASWQEGLDDLVQEFVADVLIGQGQLDYAMSVANDHQHFRNLLARQIRHLLIRRRRRTLVDNMLTRSKQIVLRRPFRLVSRGASWSYTLEGTRTEPIVAQPVRLAEIADSLADLPIVRTHASKRAPLVLSRRSLHTLLEAVGNAIPRPVSVVDLDVIFNRLLFPWVPSFVAGDADTGSRTHALNAEDSALVEEAAATVMVACSGLHHGVLGLKLRGLSDDEIGRRLGVCRPTVARRRREIVDVMRSALTGFNERMQIAALDRLVQGIPRNGSASVKWAVERRAL